MPNSIRLTYAVLVDWNGDGLFQENEIISDDIKKISCVYGRENNDTLRGRSTGGQCEVRLKNHHGNYSMFKVSGPHYDSVGRHTLILPGRAVQVRVYVGARAFVLWTGFLKTIVPHVAAEEAPYAELTAVGSLTWIDQAKYELFFNLTDIESGSPKIIARVNSLYTGDLAATILNLMGWKGHEQFPPPLLVPGPFGRRLDQGEINIDAQAVANDASVAGSGTSSRVRAIRSLRALEDVEVGFLREDNFASIVFEHRWRRLRDERQGPLFSDLAGPVEAAQYPYNPLDLSSSEEGIYNIVSGNQIKYFYDPLSQVIDAIPGGPDEKGTHPPLLIPAGETVTRTWDLSPTRHLGEDTGAAAYVWPWRNVVVAPQNTEHYNRGLGVARPGESEEERKKEDALLWDINANRTEDPGFGVVNDWIRDHVTTEQGARSIRVTIHNPAPFDIYITRLRFRGFGHHIQGSIRAYATNEESVRLYNEREYHVPTSLSYIRSIGQDNEKALAFADALADAYGKARPSGTIQVFPRTSEALALEVFGLDVSDPIRVRNENYGLLGLNRLTGHRFFIEHIEHTIEPGVEHTTEFGLSSYDSTDQYYWVLGVSTLGETTRLAF